MSLSPEQLKTAGLSDTMAREIARIDEARSSWRKSLIDANTMDKQLRELTEGSAYSRIANELKTLQSGAVSIAEQYQDQLVADPALGSVSTAWQVSERAQMEQMRKMFQPMADIRKSVLGDTNTRQFVKELTEGGSIRNHMKRVAEQPLGIGSVARMLAQQAEDSRLQTKKLLQDVGVGNSIQSYFKDFALINKRWKVPNEVLGIVGSFKELQDQLGRVALPTIDWGSAAALAKALGSEGIREQLTLLGIEPDGSVYGHDEKHERGLLSRKQSDVAALLSLLLGILFFLHQEMSSQQDKAKTEAFQTQTTAALQSLTVLIEKALVKAAQTPEERFVVRERVATVRLQPKHGSAVEAKLMPNEVVRAVDKNGKWVEVEYYHWLREEYRTGWLLKKYLERVPANFSRVEPESGNTLNSMLNAANALVPRNGGLEGQAMSERLNELKSNWLDR